MIYNEDFERGLLIGLAIAYKKAATAMQIGEFTIISIADSLVLRAIAASDATRAVFPPDVRPQTAETVTLAPIGATDSVSAILG